MTRADRNHRQPAAENPPDPGRERRRRGRGASLGPVHDQDRYPRRPGHRGQIRRLERAGCEIVRLAVPDREAAEALRKIKSKIRLPLIADIHFDPPAGPRCLARGVDGLAAQSRERSGLERRSARSSAQPKSGMSRSGSGSTPDRSKRTS